MNIPSIWLSTYYTPQIRVYMVDPHNLDTVRGELSGVTDCSLTFGYYSDTRVSGSISTVNDNYIGGSWLRIFVTIPEKLAMQDYTGVYEIATLGVQSFTSEMIPEGGESRTYSLQSVLWMLSEDAAYTLFTIGANTPASTVLRNIASICQKEITFAPGFKDGWFGNPVAYERTDSYRSILSDVASASGNQLSVDSHGRLKVDPYINPSNREVDWSIDLDSESSIVLEPGYSDTDQTGEAYNRTVVMATSNDQTIVAASDAPSDDPISSAYRGWTRTKVHQVSEMSPFTQWRAQQLTDQYIYDDRNTGYSRTCTCLYWPAQEGEILEWKQYGYTTKYLIQTIDADYSKWTVKLTLKEV